MRIGFLSSVNFYSPIVNFIEKQSKLSLVVGAVALGILSGLTLYHVITRFWSNRQVQPTALNNTTPSVPSNHLKQTVSKTASTVMVEGSQEQKDKNIKDAAEQSTLQEADQSVATQSQSIQDRCVHLNNNYHMALYLDRKCIILSPDQSYKPSRQDIINALQQFQGNVFLHINNGMNQNQLFYRDPANQKIECLEVDDAVQCDKTNKFYDILQNPNNTQIVMAHDFGFRFIA